MPKKTKRAKRLAQEHKKALLLQKFTIEEPVLRPQKSESAPVQIRKTTPVISLSSQGDVDMRSFFVSDFLKSLVLIVGIIALEIAVYFGTINNYFKF